MKETDLVRTLLDLRVRLERIEASVGRAGLLAPYEPPAFPVVELQTKNADTKMKKKAEPPQTMDETRLTEMSHSELVQAAVLIGFVHASRQVSREGLIDLILGAAQHEPADPLAEIRVKTYAFVQGNRRLMISKMRCSLHCPTCPHHKVVECYTANHDIVDAQP